MALELKVCIQNTETGKSKYYVFPQSEVTIKQELDLTDGEEYLLADWEGLNGIINENTSIASLNRLAEKMAQIPESYSNLTHDWVVHYGSIDAFSEEFNISDWTIIEVSRDEDFGEYLAKEVNGLKLPADMESYFNYQAYGRDNRLALNCVVSDTYYAWQ